MPLYRKIIILCLLGIIVGCNSGGGSSSSDNGGNDSGGDSTQSFTLDQSHLDTDTLE